MFNFWEPSLENYGHEDGGQAGQAYLGRLKHLSSVLTPKSTAEEDEEQQMDRPGRGREQGKDAEAGGASALGWAHTASVGI